MAKLNNGKTLQFPPATEPEARFQVLGEAARREVEEKRKQAGGSHLVLGVVYAQAGLPDEAERQWEQLAHENPGETKVQRMVQALRHARGQ